MKQGTFVTVSGLKSAAGVPLNGSWGVILPPESPSGGGRTARAADGMNRFPVFVFALHQAKSEAVGDNTSRTMVSVLNNAPTKSIKENNLTKIPEKNKTQVFSLLRESILSHVQAVFTKPGGTLDDHTFLGFLLLGCVQHFRNDFSLGVYYALSMVKTSLEKKSNYLAAAKILQPLLEQVLVATTSGEDCDDGTTNRTSTDRPALSPPSLPKIYHSKSEMFHEFCQIFCNAARDGQYVSDAWACLQQIGTDTTQTMQWTKNNLHELNLVCTIQLNTTIYTKRPAVAAILVKSMKMSIQLDSTGYWNAVSLSTLADSLVMTGHFIKASQLYRKVLVLKGGPDEKTTTSLILTQLQVPGMPLHQVHVQAYRDGTATCMRTDDIHVKVQGTVPTPKGRARGRVPSVGPAVPWFQYQLPTRDPNDPTVFPSWLLEQVQQPYTDDNDD